MEQETKNIIGLVLNVLILPGLGTIIHGEGKRGLIQIAVLIVSIPLMFVLLGFLTWFLVWIWALLDGVAFVQNKEFYVFKNLK